MNRKLFFVFSLNTLSCCVFAQGSAGPSALHQRVFAAPQKLVYDAEAWSYNAEAPIRSSPLVVASTVYVGTSAGDLLALHKKTGRRLWKYETGEAINSSPAYCNGVVYFSNNKQTVYAINAGTGKLVWKFDMGPKQLYPWRFDYFYSSPCIHNSKLFIGGDDGLIYALQFQKGKVIWKYKARTIVRSSPVVHNGFLYFGDMDGRLIALDEATGKEAWQFSTVGDTLKNEDWGFDRKAMLSSPVIAGNKILVGCRDGWLYCVDMQGKEKWRMNHNVSWVISTMAVKDSFVITGTSDGRFVQAVHIETGKELWKFRSNSLFWSSAAVVNDQVYMGSFDGVMYCLDLKTGRRLSQFNTGDKILSSAVYNDGLLYFGSDDGRLYTLKGSHENSVLDQKRFVYYESGINHYFRGGADLRIKNYLVNHGYKLIGSDTLAAVMKEAANSVVVFASNYFPSSIINQKQASQLRTFLDAGGRVVLLGVNPLVFKFDDKTKQAVGFNVAAADTVLGLHYGPSDTRGIGGQFPCFATAEGRALNLPPFWIASTFLNASETNVVLGKNENGSVSSFVKNYGGAGRLVQLFFHPDVPAHLDAILKAAEGRF